MGCLQSKKDLPCCQNCNSTKILIENVYSSDESGPADFYCEQCQNSPCPNCNTSQHVIKIKYQKMWNCSKMNQMMMLKLMTILIANYASYHLMERTMKLPYLKNH